MLKTLSTFLNKGNDTDKSMKGHLLFAANPGQVKRLPGELDQFTFLSKDEPALKGSTPPKAIGN